jgi:LPS-assembly lipoprotein
MRGDFEIVAPSSRSGYFLARGLEERLGLPSSPDYRLQLMISQGAQVTGIPADRVTARANIIGQVDYTLVYIPSREVVRRGSVESFTGFSATSTTAATRAAAEDANVRLMTLLADRIAIEGRAHSTRRSDGRRSSWSQCRSARRRAYRRSA